MVNPTQSNPTQSTPTHSIGESGGDLSGAGWIEDYITVVERYPGEFRRDFPVWLRENPDLWSAFYHKSVTLMNAGRSHFSARTIIEVIRWDSAIHSQGDIYKINNNWAPDMARLFMKTVPGAGDLFALRETYLRAS